MGRRAWQPWAATVLIAAGLAGVAHGQTDPLVDEFARCDDWLQPPTQPGVVVIACDQAQLDRFIASGLTHAGGGGAVIEGPESRSREVPGTYSGAHDTDLGDVTIVGSGSPTTVYTARYVAAGTLLEATFRDVALPAGTPLRIRVGEGSVALADPSGAAIATAPATVTWLGPAAVVARPRAVHVSRRGRRVSVSWIGERGALYEVSAKRSRSAHAATRVAARVRALSARRVRVAFRVRAAERWLSIVGIRPNAKGPPAVVRMR